MVGPDPFANYTGTQPAGPYAGSRKRLLPDGTATLTTSYQLLMPRNTTRTGFDIQSVLANTTNMVVRFGTTGPEWEISPGGGFSRNNKTGNVWNGDIWIKAASGTPAFIAEEH